MNDMHGEIERAVESVRLGKPLAGAITNAITMDFVANAQLAVGGSAAMVYLGDEGAALAEMGDAFYINMGALLPEHRESIPQVARACNAAGKPWVLDPVGIGIGEVRLSILNALRDTPPSIVRGNASEIIALAGLWGALGSEEALAGVRGVDATDAVDDARLAADALARFIGGAVAVSGEADYVTDGTRAVSVPGGSALMERVTGFGCSLGGVMAVYVAVADPFAAAVAASCHYKAAGTAAAAQAAGPGSFKVAFLDELYRLAPDAIAAVLPG